MDENNTQHQTPPPQNGPSNHSGGNPLNQLESWLELYLGQKAPQLPQNWREVIVKIAPWITLVLMVLALPIILFALGIGTIVAPFAFFGGLHAGGMYMVVMILTAASVVLEIMALPGLFHRKMTGWRYVYWATLITAVANIFSFNLGGLVGVVISLYILFQVKKLYH